MIQRLLIANRGEIARRIIRTARACGISTLAIHSRDDRGTLHTLEAEKSIELPDRNDLNPYLQAEAIVEIARAHSADAIHPGYGFLSENADFAELVRENNLAFIGPSAECIRTLGDKHQARSLAQSLSIPTLSGLSIAELDKEARQTACEEIGYPLMIKASNAGGGRGMRRVYEPSELETAIEGVRTESALFGAGGNIVAERLLEQARHIEVQLCGFGDGSVIHLMERDCSLQRRFQKLIEESPALDLPPGLREAIFEAALGIARAGSLRSLATAEFLVQGDEFYFLEVNPRLQVEHPVTELVLGRDLVELQIRAATEDDFSLTQDQIQPENAAVELRIVAESPEEGFLPSTARLLHYSLPPDVRVDHALSTQRKSSTAYDSLLAKCIVAGKTVPEARANAQAALSSLSIIGPATNAGFLFTALNQSTPFTINCLDKLLCLHNESVDVQLLHQYAAFGAALVQEMLFPYDESLSRLQRYGRTSENAQVFILESDSFPGENIEIQVKTTAKRHCFHIEQQSFSGNLLKQEGSLYTLSCKSQRGDVTLEAFVLQEAVLRVCIRIGAYCFVVRHKTSTQKAALKSAASQKNQIRAPLPGTILSLAVAPGDFVLAGEPLLRIESMKIEHSIHAEADCSVKEVAVREKEFVERGQILVELQQKKDSPS